MNPRAKPLIFTMSRRRFIGVMGLGGLAVTWRGRAEDAPSPAPGLLPSARVSPWPLFRISRPEDHLCLDVELVNLRVVAEQPGRRLVHIASHGQNGFIVLRFPGQHYAEQAVWDRGTQTPPAAGTSGDTDMKKDPPAPHHVSALALQGGLELDAHSQSAGRDDLPAQRRLRFSALCSLARAGTAIRLRPSRPDRARARPRAPLPVEFPQPLEADGRRG